MPGQVVKLSLGADSLGRQLAAGLSGRAMEGPSNSAPHPTQKSPPSQYLNTTRLAHGRNSRRCADAPDGFADDAEDDADVTDPGQRHQSPLSEVAADSEWQRTRFGRAPPPAANTVAADRYIAFRAAPPSVTVSGRVTLLTAGRCWWCYGALLCRGANATGCKAMREFWLTYRRSILHLLADCEP